MGVPRFSLDVSLEDLKVRPRNSEQAISAATETANQMLGHEADAMSGRWTDRDGQTLVAYFSHREEQLDAWQVGDAYAYSSLLSYITIFFKSCRRYPGPQGRTLADVQRKQELHMKDPQKHPRVFFDGIGVSFSFAPAV